MKRQGEEFSLHALNCETTTLFLCQIVGDLFPNQMEYCARHSEMCSCSFHSSEKGVTGIKREEL